jgi:hypothetical protein
MPSTAESSRHLARAIVGRFLRCAAALPPAWARGVLLGLRAFQCSHWQWGHPARGDDAGPAAGHAEVRHGPAGRGVTLEAIMTTYEHFQGQVRRRPIVTRHSRLQRHRTSPLGSGYAEEFELACRGYRGDPGRDCRKDSSEIRPSHGFNRVNGNGSSIPLPSTARSRTTRTTSGSSIVVRESTS